MLAGTIGGFLSGLCGMGGPPMVLWVMAHANWTSRQMRASLLFFAVIVSPTNVLFYGLAYPKTSPQAMLDVLWVLPFVLLCALIGLWAGNKLNRHILRRVMLAVLWIMGLMSLVAPWL